MGRVLRANPISPLVEPGAAGARPRRAVDVRHPRAGATTAPQPWSLFGGLPVHRTAIGMQRAVVLHTQSTAGNRATQQLLRRSPAPDASIQRTLGDGHDLTSPRFLADPRLEACFDNEARLAQGAQGESVTKVQQALIDLGHDLGPSGADGIYGAKTSNAVRQFKAAQRLGFEQFGDVGPGTMGRLDQLFPPTPIEPPAPKQEAEEDDTSCPFSVDDLLTTVAEPETAVTAGPDVLAAQPTTAGAPHMSIGDSIKRFQAQVNVVGIASGGAVDKNVSDRGQFFWSLHVGDAILAEINRLSGVPSARDFATKAREAHRLIDSRQDAKAALRELDGIAAKSTSPERSAMQALLAPDVASGPGHELRLWEAYIKDDTNRLPNLSGQRSLRVFQSMTKAEKTACWSHAIAVARKLKKKGGLKPRDTTVKAVSARLAGNSVRDRNPDPAGSTTHKGDVFDQPGVAGVIPELKKALDAGQVIHARVLSGVGFGTNPNVPAEPGSRKRSLGPPPEEHSLLLIGFDGDTFVFSDPDAAVSNTPVPGFGQLTFDGKRLSTAVNDADLPVTAGGRHARGDKRYQIISLVTV